MLIFDAPAHAESFFREAEREIREVPRDLSKIPALGKSQQINFQPPK